MSMKTGKSAPTGKKPAPQKPAETKPAGKK